MNQNRLIRGTFIYAIGNLGTKLLSFLVVPFYTYYISTTQYGIYENLVTAGNLLLPLMNLQIADAIYTRFLSGKGNVEQDLSCAYFILAAGSLATSLLVGLVSLVFPFPYAGLFILYNICQAFWFTIQKLCRALGRQGLFATSGLVYTIVFLTLNVIQIIFLHMGIDAFLTSAIAASLAGALFVLVQARALIFFRLSLVTREALKKLLSFSIPLIPNQINWWVMNFSDKFLITWFLSLAANGIYGIAARFPSLLQMALDFFNTSWSDVSISSEGNAGYSALFERFYLFAFSLLVPLIPATQLFITLFMDPSYHSAQNYVGILYMGTVFQAFSAFYGVGYLKSGQTTRAGSTSVYGAVVNFVINLVLIRVIGLQAAAISTFAGFLVMWLVRERQNRKALDIRIRWPLFVSIALSDLLFGAFCFSLPFWAKMLVVLIGAVLFLYVNRSVFLSALRAIRRPA